MLKAGGDYLDTEASWSDEYYQMAYSQPVFGLDKGWYEDKSKWKTFNQFFARHLSSPSVRPIASPDDDAVIAAAADSKPQGVWDIDEDGYIINEVQIKSKKFFSVVELLGPNCQYKNAFNGGTMTHSFLNVFDYHRYHFPVSGTIKEVDIVAGEYAVGGEVKWNATNKTYDLYCDEPSWQSIETRGRIVLETPSNGLVAILPIGMMPVTSINWRTTLKWVMRLRKVICWAISSLAAVISLFSFRKGISLTSLSLRMVVDMNISIRERNLDGFLIKCTINNAHSEI